MEQVHIRFQGSTERETHELAQSGQVAVEQAVDSLEREGVGAVIVSVAPEDSGGLRGLPFEDVVINVVANAITTLLFRIVGEVITRVRIARARRAHAQPAADDVVTVQMGQRRISFPVDIPPESLYQQLELWTATAPSADITIGVMKFTPPQ